MTRMQIRTNQFPPCRAELQFFVGTVAAVNLRLTLVQTPSIGSKPLLSHTDTTNSSFSFGAAGCGVGVGTGATADGGSGVALATGFGVGVGVAFVFFASIVGCFFGSGCC